MIGSFRTHMLSLSFFVGMVVVTFWTDDARAIISNGDSKSVEERVNILERISDSQAQLIQQFHQQLFANQHELDHLRGQIQENSYRLNQALESQKKLYQQIDNLIKDGANNTVVTTTPMPMQSHDANIAYNAAVALVLEKKQYDQAIIAFQVFVKKYPDSTYQPNANYWLGQLHYNKGKREEAAYYFAKVAKNYPTSYKSADALLKIGIIMEEKGNNAKAKSIYQQVVKLYPNSGVAKQAQRRSDGL